MFSGCLDYKTVLNSKRNDINIKFEGVKFKHLKIEYTIANVSNNPIACIQYNSSRRNDYYDSQLLSDTLIDNCEFYNRLNTFEIINDSLSVINTVHDYSLPYRILMPGEILTQRIRFRKKHKKIIIWFRYLVLEGDLNSLSMLNGMRLCENDISIMKVELIFEK